MSAPVESSTKAGGDVAAATDSRLEQPTDAVPMENMPQPSSSQDQPNVPAGDAAVDHQQTPPASSSNAAPADSDKPQPNGEHDGDAPSASLKGKEKDDAPPPPAKESETPEAVMAIGPAQETIGLAAPGGPDSEPVCCITLLLTSGSRHPYRIDGKYLARRNVTIPEETEAGLPDPFSISIYTLKELILREWRSDWEAKPASPSSIRLIHFGKLLDDKEPLRKYQFGTESPNVVHMSIRPQDLDEEEPKTGSKNLAAGSGEGRRSTSGSCCVIL